MAATAATPISLMATGSVTAGAAKFVELCEEELVGEGDAGLDVAVAATAEISETICTDACAISVRGGFLSSSVQMLAMSAPGSGRSCQ